MSVAQIVGMVWLVGGLIELALFYDVFANGSSERRKRKDPERAARIDDAAGTLRMVLEAQRGDARVWLAVGLTLLLFLVFWPVLVIVAYLIPKKKDDADA